MEALLDRLLSQAYLFDDPGAYEAGVRDAIEAATARDVATARAAADARGATDARGAAQARAETDRLAESMRDHPSTGAPRRLRSVEHSAA